MSEFQKGLGQFIKVKQKCCRRRVFYAVQYFRDVKSRVTAPAGMVVSPTKTLKKRGLAGTANPVIFPDGPSGFKPLSMPR
jgi:hypothetical protein